jgi:hypothetical protein
VAGPSAHAVGLLAQHAGGWDGRTAAQGLCRALTPAGTDVSDLSWSRLLVAGGLGGMAGWVSTYPWDVIKTKMQSDATGTGRT